MNLTQKAIQKFESTEPTIRLANGVTKVASIQFPHNTGGFKLEVERTPESLRELSGRNKDKSVLVMYDTRAMYSGICQEPPRSLAHVVEKLYTMLEMSPTEQEEQLNRMIKNMREFYESMGLAA